MKKILLTALAAVALNLVSGFNVVSAEVSSEANLSGSEETTASVEAKDNDATLAPPFAMGVKDDSDEDFPMTVEGRWFSPRLNAEVQTDNTSYNGGYVSLKDTLGFGNDKAPEFIFRYNRFKLDYIHVHGTGDANVLDVLGNNLIFDDVRYAGDVHSQSDFHYLKLDFTNPIITEENYGVDWMYGLTGMYWEGSVKGQGRDTITGQTGTYETSEKFGVPVPTLGVGAHAYVAPGLKAYAQIEGLPLGGYGHFYDLEAGIRYKPISNLGINVGYRRIEVKYHHSGDEGKVRLNGPFFGLNYDF